MEFNLFFNKCEKILFSFFYFRNKAKNYKYICNINSYHYKNITFFEEWKNYIYNNLLGNSKIISEIITDFEHNKTLGIIFPEKYYKSYVYLDEYINALNLKYLNFLIRKIDIKSLSMQNFFDFPEGNMFWAKVSAIYPIFNLYPKIVMTKKSSLIIQNNLEYIWVFLLKLNGFFYKKIFKHL